MENVVKITIGDLPATLVLRDPMSREPISKTRVYVDSRYEEPDYAAYYDAEPTEARRIRLRMVASMREVLTDAQAAPNAVEGFSTAKLAYSSKAGCSCGCSPGFVADRRFYYEGRPVLQLSIG